jgi:predicted nucleotide-binding protein (sugar kinase/HSP70/actin superfamily)
MDLIDKKVDFIFYPCIPYDGREFDGTDNHYNCPIVASYAENIKNNVEPIRDGTMPFMRPFLTLHDTDVLAGQLIEAAAELELFRQTMREEGMKVVDDVRSGKYPGIELAGRPYHTDHEIHHGIPAIINQLGFAVLTEDSISHMDKDYKKLRILDQWVYHSRLYAAAQVVGETDGLELVQLNSFGCGLDAITSDQVEEILKAYGKTFTLIKIDEVSNLGAARIRLRSLKAAIDERKESGGARPDTKYQPYSPAMFESHMKDEYTIIAPQMSPIHFSLLEHSFKMGGYRLEILPKVSKNAKELGLKYVNNDACYPAIIVIGQLMEAIDSGKYDLNRLAVMMSQTGGACRASNYLSLLRKALADRGLSHIPAISLSTGLEKHPGFKISPKMLISAVFALLYGDLFNRLVLRTRPYETQAGAADALHTKWEAVAVRNLYNVRFGEFRRNVRAIIKDFDELEIEGTRKPRVGVVGEILVKFHPGGNNELVAQLEKLGAEASVPDLYDFLLYATSSKEYQASRMMPSKIARFGYNRLIDLMEWLRKPIVRELRKYDKFDDITSIRHIAEGAKPFLSLGNRAGEGWFLTGEMVELIEHGVENIVCTQPFACLPNHIVGKGTVRTLRDAYPHSNIVPIDYDPGDTNVNQINRIELMLSVARERELFKQG